MHVLRRMLLSLGVLALAVGGSPPDELRASNPACWGAFPTLVEAEVIVSPTGNLEAYALLRNTTECWINQSTLLWRFFDGDGVQVDQFSDNHTWPGIVRPGGRYASRFIGSVEPHASWTVSVGDLSEFEGDPPDYPLSVGPVTVSPLEDGIQVTFPIDTRGVCNHIGLHGTALGFDAAGDLVQGVRVFSSNTCSTTTGFGSAEAGPTEGIVSWMVFMEQNSSTGSTWTTWNNYFGDLYLSPFAADVEWIANQAITGGCGQNRYCPSKSVTRGQMASFLARALDLPGTMTDYFTDDETSQHEADINRVRGADIAFGCRASSYCPAATVTRAQMASFLARALDLPGTTADYFTDDEDSIHESAINRVKAAGITGGCGANRYCPANPVTRGQMAAFLRRAFDN